MKIIKYDGHYVDEIKLLLVQLQKYLIEIDDENVLVMTDNYKDEYFDFVLKTLNDNNGIMYLAVENNEVLGLITGMIKQPDDEDKIVNSCPTRGYVSEFIIEQNVRKQGVGRLLMETIEKWFKQQNCDFIRIDVLAQNSNALKFYKNSGYTPINIEVSKRIK